VGPDVVGPSTQRDLTLRPFVVRDRLQHSGDCSRFGPSSARLWEAAAPAHYRGSVHCGKLPGEPMTLTRRRLLQVTSAAVGTATLSIPASTAHAVTEAASAKATFQRNAWSRMRGMTAPSSLTEADIAAFAATGGNLLRVGFSNRPLMRKEEPFDLDPGAFEQLDRILDSCERHGVRV